ncbi:MAG: membrane protein insertion efficiency factor YidD [Candidatus Hydrothermales bacterium]
MKNFLIILIKVIRIFSNFFPPSCRFYPTCSYYAEMSIRDYGVLKGLILSAFRIFRCNPFSRGGINYPYEDYIKLFKK